MENRDDFWAEAAEGIDWYKPFDKVCGHETAPQDCLSLKNLGAQFLTYRVQVLDDSNPPFYRW